MEDSNTMTINFLRARLQSERTISSTARQRADELAQRVAELEEQLRFVNIQRNKAEKAMGDVLAILETRGITDASEDYYLNSDNDEMSNSLKKVNDFSKEEESSEDFSFPEVESSRVSGRSLFIKGRQDSSPTLEKYKEASVRRRSGLSSVGKPSKHRPGKLHRQIRQSEQSSEAFDCISNPQQPNHDNDEVYSDKVCTNSGGMQPEWLGDEVEFHREKSQLLEDEKNAVIPLHEECNERGQEINMEKALEHQAQLIGQYEAMEEAQREWEEKFTENNNNTLEHCDLGNHSDVTEEAEEPQSIRATLQVMVPAVEAKSVVGASVPQMSPEIQHKYSVPDSRSNTGHLVVSLTNQEAPLAATLIPNSKGNHERLDFSNQPPLKTSSTSHGPIYHDAQKDNAADYPHFVAGTLLQRGEVSTNRGESNALVPHGTAGTLAGVLDSLKQARLMLQKQIGRVPKSDHGPRINTTEQCLLKPEPGNNLDVPGGLSGLFGPPSGMSLTNPSKGYVPLSGTQSSLAGSYPRDQDVLPAVHPSMRNHYRASNPGSLIDDRLISGQFIDAGTRTMSLNLGMSQYQDINSHAHSHYHPHPDAMPGMLSHDRTHRPTPTSGTSAPPVSRLDPLMYNENLYTRSPMYRH